MNYKSNEHISFILFLNVPLLSKRPRERESASGQPRGKVEMSELNWNFICYFSLQFPHRWGAGLLHRWCLPSCYSFRDERAPPPPPHTHRSLLICRQSSVDKGFFFFKAEPTQSLLEMICVFWDQPPSLNEWFVPSIHSCIQCLWHSEKCQD